MNGTDQNNQAGILGKRNNRNTFFWRETIVFGLPKTRSGKIMRRILRKIAEGELNQLGDTTTLLDPMVVEDIKKGRL